MKLSALSAVLTVSVITVTACATQPNPSRSAVDQPKGQAYAEIRQEPEGPATGQVSDATALVQKFLTSWSRRDLTQDQWWAELDPLCTHELSGLLRTQNMNQLRAATYSAPKLTTRDATSLTYAAQAKNATIKIVVVMRDQQWEVSNLTPSDTAPQKAD